ncbi:MULTISPECIES: hypothetical protein [Clostridium]|uniref:Glycosyl transferases group 1 n=1 Tax=Clostridium cibarium TaxID=2762247 RepID=A0ABR8PQ70_9CLOT|nr:MULTISPECIES: hypothetical protein [Clostridium]MBD7910323.1 hypothetical protein [Clostridium cibarium]
MKDIYILCPAKVATGGPELLHQLCYKLNKIGINAKMFYVGDIESNPIHPNYEIYNNKYITKIKDTENNILILPEIHFPYMDIFPLSQKIIWWLSVDNFLSRLTWEDTPSGSYSKEITYLYRNTELIHFVQSEYANSFLSELEIDKNKIYYLSDYLNKTFIDECKNSNYIRENNVLYNPNKGLEFTKKLIKKVPDLNWIPLINYTPAEMAELMQKSKVYIDFGNHPGKDRIPREAAISGCCILTNLKGSAQFYEDIPISEEYKFQDKDENIDLIIEKIHFLLNNFDTETNKFNYYRETISNEEMKFEKAVENVFSKLLTD